MPSEFTAKVKGYIDTAHVYVTLVISIAAGLAAIGFSVSPPWPAKADVADVQKTVQTLLVQQQKTDRLALQTQRILLQAQLRDAEKELQGNPNSWSAQQLVSQLKDQIAEIDRALQGSPHP